MSNYHANNSFLLRTEMGVYTVSLESKCKSTTFGFKSPKVLHVSLIFIMMILFSFA